jgi:hypothetical protein
LIRWTEERESRSEDERNGKILIRIECICYKYIYNLFGA